MDGNNDHLEEAFRLLARTIVRSDPGRLEVWAALGLTMTQLRLLFQVRESAGASAGMLADSLKVTPSTLTRIMDRLLRNRLICRQVDDGDRRLVRHYLTPAAEELVGELERTGREEFYAIFRELRPDQLERLIAALRDLATASEAAEARHETEKASVA